MSDSKKVESNFVTVTIWSLVLCAVLYAIGHFIVIS